MTVSTATAWTPVFASGTIDYHVDVPVTTTQVDVAATVTDATASADVNGSGAATDTNIALGAPDSITDIVTIVTPQCGGVTNTYTVHVHRSCSTDNTLSALTVSTATAWTPVFASGTIDYHVDVPVTTTQVDVAATVTDATASADVNGSGAATDTNIALGAPDSITDIVTIVTPQCGGVTNTYTVHVHRPAARTTRCQR